MYTVSPETIKHADALASEKYGIPELTLMKNAARACFIHVPYSLGSKIVILCGKGNNGGDGYKLAAFLKKFTYKVAVINVFDCIPNTETAQKVYNECIETGVKILPSDRYSEIIERADVIIDALFGIGFHGNIEKDSKIGKMLTLCNSANAERIAVDVPSGINSADGTAGDVVFKADITITMAYIKTGMLSYPAKEYCGEIKLANIGYPHELCSEIPKDALIPDDKYIDEIIPKRELNTHKGTYGRLLMYCASENMTGAGVLAANGALRSGCGLINLAGSKETVNKLQMHLIEPIFSVLSEDTLSEELVCLSQKATAALCGCGLGVSEKSKEAIISLIKNSSCNIILDADGINMLCGNTLILKEARKTPILTPHPLEFSRLIGKSVDEVQANRINLAREFAKEFGCVLVLKGAGTVIASPDGRLAINTSGNPGLAKGGSGDVLAGIIASLCAQGLSPFDSAAAGVYLHGKAADLLKKRISEYGFLPSDLPRTVAKLLP